MSGRDDGVRLMDAATYPGLILAVARHAHAQAAVPGGLDRERTLDRRGRTETTEMARRCRDLRFFPDLILASPALRTRQTADAFARYLDVPAARVLVADTLYPGELDQLWHCIVGAEHGSRRLLVIAHNPGISELARQLGPDVAPASFDPCAVLLVARCEAQWSEIAGAHNAQARYESPLRPFIDCGRPTDSRMTLSGPA